MKSSATAGSEAKELTLVFSSSEGVEKPNLMIVQGTGQFPWTTCWELCCRICSITDPLCKVYGRPHMSTPPAGFVHPSAKTPDTVQWRKTAQTQMICEPWLKTCTRAQQKLKWVKKQKLQETARRVNWLILNYKKWLSTLCIKPQQMTMRAICNGKNSWNTLKLGSILIDSTKKISNNFKKLRCDKLHSQLSSNPWIMECFNSLWTTSSAMQLQGAIRTLNDFWTCT